MFLSPFSSAFILSYGLTMSEKLSNKYFIRKATLKCSYLSYWGVIKASIVISGTRDKGHRNKLLHLQAAYSYIYVEWSLLLDVFGSKYLGLS